MPISLRSDVYARMITGAQRDRLHRYHRIEGGNHLDSLVDLDPRQLRLMLPCFRTAFDALTARVEDGRSRRRVEPSRAWPAAAPPVRRC